MFRVRIQYAFSLNPHASIWHVLCFTGDYSFGKQSLALHSPEITWTREIIDQCSPVPVSMPRLPISISGMLLVTEIHQLRVTEMVRCYRNGKDLGC